MYCLLDILGGDESPVSFSQHKSIIFLKGNSVLSALLSWITFSVGCTWPYANMNLLQSSSGNEKIKLLSVMLLTPLREQRCMFPYTEAWMLLCVTQLQNFSSVVARLTLPSCPPSLCAADHIKHQSVSVCHCACCAVSPERTTEVHLDPLYARRLVIFSLFAHLEAVTYMWREESAEFLCSEAEMGQQASVADDLDEAVEVLSTISGKDPRNAFQVLCTSVLSVYCLYLSSSCMSHHASHLCRNFPGQEHIYS